MKYIALYVILSISCYAQCPPCLNQTAAVFTPLPEDSLPYRVNIELADFQLPTGIHSFAYATYQGEWLLIGGRTNGLHDVDNTDPNVNPFSPAQRNTVVYVVNPTNQTVYYRSLYDSSSELSSLQIDLLSVNNPLFYYAESKNTLYLAGGYGIDSATNAMTTKPALTAIDVPQMIRWVKNAKKARSAAQCIRTLFHPVFQLTGGVMLQANEHAPFLLAFGQNFSGIYTTSSNGSYSQQIRPIQILDNGRNLQVQLYKQPDPIDTYRRRDLNVIPIIKKQGKSLTQAFTALSGVFTSVQLTDIPGAWTIPIEINANGSSSMLDPNNPSTFAQGMNNYSCATVGLYSISKNKMYTLLFGGISAAVFGEDGSNCNEDPNPQCNCCTAWVPTPGNTFQLCCNLPFTNDVTTIEIDAEGVYRQYIMSGTYPTINSYPPVCPGFTPLTCDGDPLQTIYFFGANSAFIPASSLSTFSNGVISFDTLKQDTFVGYIVGGIASTIRDTNCTTDSQASPYVFKVTISPQ